MTRKPLVLLHTTTGATRSYSHALATLAGVLHRDGYGADELLLITLDTETVRATSDQILSLSPHSVLVTAMSNQWHRVSQLAELIKQEAPQIRLYVGGTHVTAAPDTFLCSRFDSAVVGEGEMVLMNLLTASSPPRIVKGDAVADLDHLPMPYLPLFDPADMLEYPSVMFSRGCPYHCSYCMSRNGGIGGRVRWKSPSRAIQEVAALIDYAGPKEIFIDDDTLLKNPTWVARFCDEYKANFAIPFLCNARPETVKAPILDRLVRAGCSAIGIGIESGSSRLRAQVLDREMSDDVIIKAFFTAKSVGLRTWSFNMVGLPGETADDLKATVEINERARVDFVRVSIFTPYPGTPAVDASDLHDKPYIRSPRDLPDDLRNVYVSWIFRLREAGRLWVTDTEEKICNNQ
jgi:anaerobic magnesium-protoporphyrin IX monomethyl ester cyclase